MYGIRQNLHFSHPTNMINVAVRVQKISTLTATFPTLHNLLIYTPKSYIFFINYLKDKYLFSSPFPIITRLLS